MPPTLLTAHKPKKTPNIWHEHFPRSKNLSHRINTNFCAKKQATGFTHCADYHLQKSAPLHPNTLDTPMPIWHALRQTYTFLNHDCGMNRY